MARSGRSFLKNEDGAIAPLYALTLTGLIAIGGIAFDYSRMASMDTELQNAADQAALAAASQLDGTAGAKARAIDAAKTLVANQTRFANDGVGRGVGITDANIRFFSCDTNACRADRTRANMTEVTSDANVDQLARFVEVTVDNREVFYALTPVVNAIKSGPMTAAALAGLGSAICRVPPLMMCNPAEPASNTNVDLEFDADSYQGTGIRLVANDSYTPGAFGFLKNDKGGARDLKADLSWNTPPGDCSAVDGVEIKNGMNASVLDGLNTRFDMPGSGNSCPNVGGVTGVCSPSVNVRKDLVRGVNNCNWDENTANSGNFASRRYRPTSATLYPTTTTPQIMGHPRDLCHAWGNVGDCSSSYGGRIGTGDWDINAYWRSNYGSDYGGQVSTATYGPQPKGYPTRYQVYLYEAANAASTIGIAKTGTGGTAYAQPQAGRCLATSSSPYGIVPGGANVDRRRLSVALLNCYALKSVHGSSLNNKVLEVAKWIDIFLVEPSLQRRKCQGGAGCNDLYTEATDVYVEVIGETNAGAGQTAGQVVRRDVPYLIE
jgi:Flp pilus assembly protein TadG